VITVSRLSRFHSGMGQTSPYDGNVYGFLGEVKEGQLPPLMKLPDALSLAVREVVAASDEEVDVWYGEGPENPRVPNQGDELVGEFEGGLGANVKVPLLQYLPRAWAPFASTCRRSWCATSRTSSLGGATKMPTTRATVEWLHSLSSKCRWISRRSAARPKSEPIERRIF
jgi:hypothetical protein